MSAKKMGTPAWNKGLTAAESGSVASYTQKQVGNTRGRANKGKPQPLTTLRNRTNNPMKRPEVRAKVSLLVRGRYGERNPNWGGGGKSYRGWDWPQQSAAARQRDNATCRACGKRRGRLNVHHVIPYEQTQDNGLDNLVTLCVGCHAKVEAGTIPCPTTPPRPPTQPTAAAPLPAT
jgi:5-methylcytosine-specific restriction endonuclease McrA